MKLRERFMVEIPTSHKITTMEVSQLNTQIEKEITRERANRERRRRISDMVRGK
jgi:hypothetical protein